MDLVQFLLPCWSIFTETYYLLCGILLLDYCNSPLPVCLAGAKCFTYRQVDYHVQHTSSLTMTLSGCTSHFTTLAFSTLFPFLIWIVSITNTSLNSRPIVVPCYTGCGPVLSSTLFYFATTIQALRLSHFTSDAAALQPSHVLYAHVLHAHTSAVYYFLSFVLATQPTTVSYFFPSYFRLYWPHLLVVFSSAGSLQRFVMFSWLLLFFSPLWHRGLQATGFLFAAAPSSDHWLLAVFIFRFSSEEGYRFRSYFLL